MSEGFKPERLWFIKTQADGSKYPTEEWGGYSQEYESAEAVYSLPDVRASNHNQWGLVGVKDKPRTTFALLIFDLDVYKAPEGFDPDRVTIPEDTLVVRTQSGGFHVYFVVHGERGGGAESDFTMTQNLGWDIDIRGSYVSQHVLAPDSITGVQSDYEVVSDTGIKAVTDPADAAERIRIDGEPLLEYDSTSGVGSFDFTYESDPPEQMPRCYHNGLQLRHAAPDDHPNPHKVNTLTALCGLAAGYEPEEIVRHFVEQFPPGSSSAADREETEYQVNQMARKMERGSLAAPAISTLRNWGILESGEACSCAIPYHGRTAGQSCQEVATDGGTQASNPTPGGDSDAGSDDTLSLSPNGVIQAALADPHGRLERADDPKDNPTVHDLRQSEAATYVWQVMGRAGFDDVRAVVDKGGSTTELRGYNDGIWRKNGEQKLREYSRQALRSAHSSNLVGELEEEVRSRKQTHVRREALGAPDGTVAVANGLLHLLEREEPQLEQLEREHYAIRRINAEYDPDAPTPKRWLDHLDRCIRDEQDRKRLQEYFGYTLWHHRQPFGKALFLLGPTNSGKGTAIKVLEDILGTENVAHEALGDLVDGRWGPAGLYESVANMRDEVTAGGLEKVERFKELTGGGDTITAEFKNQDKFEFPVYQKFVYATNTIPSVKNADEAFYNRCLFVKFPTTIPESEQTNDYHDRLLEERSGILNWMLGGLRRLMDQNHFTGERTITEKKAICDAFGNVTDRFVHNCLEVVDDSDVITHKEDMFNFAQAYAEQVDMDSPWDSRQGFTEDLKSYSGIQQKQSKKLTGANVRVFSCVKPRAEAVEAANADVRYNDPRQEANQEQLG